jgi:hypothetical protein
MTEIEKLRVMLPHWIEHNRSHGEDFKKWAGILKDAGAPETAVLLEKAIAGLAEADQALSQALEKAGGPPDEKDTHHHHH